MAQDYIGGAGFGIKHLYDEVKPEQTPWDPRTS
jgi:aldehyde:ferredoxin oxidoreductase